jgi:hypothetical protein
MFGYTLNIARTRKNIKIAIFCGGGGKITSTLIGLNEAILPGHSLRGVAHMLLPDGSLFADRPLLHSLLCKNDAAL